MKKFLLPLFITFSINASSQVYNAGTIFNGYTDINPDTLLNYTVAPYTNEVYDIDMFGDATGDIEITAHGAVSSGGSGAYLNITVINPDVLIMLGRIDSVFTPSSGLWNVTNVAAPLNIGDPLDASSAKWDNTILYMTDHSSSGGGNKNVNDFIGGDKYIGVKYQSSTGSAYGWIRVQCPTEDKCYLKDFSFTPATIGIREHNTESLKVFPNPATDHFILRNLNKNEWNVLGLKITDVYGNNVDFNYEASGNDVKVSLLPSTPPGCYIVMFSSSETSCEKIIKIK